MATDFAALLACQRKSALQALDTAEEALAMEQFAVELASADRVEEAPP